MDDEHSLAGRRILVVEDHPTNRAFAAALREAGAEVILECGGDAAVDQARCSATRNQAFDAILLDLAEGMLAAIRSLRAAGYDGRLIAMADDPFLVEQEWWAWGCDAVLPRNEPGGALTVAVRRWIDAAS